VNLAHLESSDCPLPDCAVRRTAPFVTALFDVDFKHPTAFCLLLSAYCPLNLVTRCPSPVSIYLWSIKGHFCLIDTGFER
jgi:hypothetical protein